MVKIKKMVKSLSYLYVELQEHIEMAESFNVEMIRIKSNDKIVLKMFNDIDTARTRKFMGFKQVKFDKRGNKQFFSGCLMLYPSPDFYWYGYLPVTEDNLERLARMLKSGVVRIDEMDVEVSEQFDDLCDEKSISTALLPKRNYLGQSSSV